MWHDQNNQFSYLKKKNVSFWRYIDYCVFEENANFKICDVIILFIPHYSFYYFVRILGTIKTKLVRNYCSISNLFLALLWRLEACWKPFLNFNKMTILCNPLVFSKWCLLVLIFSKTVKKQETRHNWFLINCLRLVN